MRLQLHLIVTTLLTTQCFGMEQTKKEIEKDLHQIKEDLYNAKHDIATVIGMVSPQLATYIKGESKAITNNPYKHKDAYVRQGAGISNGEKDFLKKRSPIVKAALEKLLNRQLNEKHTPTIALVHSGGGCRAKLCTTGSLRGAQKIGLLDTTTYVIGLSGSTWAIAPWISTEIPLKVFKEYILDCIEKPFTDLTDKEELLLFDAATVKSAYQQPKTPVDLYGDLLGNRLLVKEGDNRYMIYLSDQAKIVENGTYPYPIYTAIDADEKIVTGQTWYEFNPHEIGNHLSHIPSWSYGRYFEEGKSIKKSFTSYPPEKNLAYHMGTWGSAFGANIKTIETEAAKRIGHWELIEKLLKPIEGARPLKFYAEIPNYEYKIDPATPHDQEAQNKFFVDAGTYFNLPVLPVSGLCPERKADIIIICDASGDDIGDELRKTTIYMKQHNLPFPTINFENIDKETMSVFNDKHDPNVPLVIYLPRISDQQLWEKNKENPQFKKYNLSGFDLDHETNHGFAQTQHFQYERKNAQKVIDQTEFNMRVNAAKIIKAIEWKIDQKNTQ